MQNILKLIVLILFLPTCLTAQICKGKLIEKETKSPVQNANVFLAGTSIGTTTNSEGAFSFDMQGNFFVPLVISFVGYKTKVVSIYEIRKDSVILFERDSLQIGEIDVKSGKSGWSRSKMLHVFKEEFLGTSFNARACKIKNEKDIYLFYNEDTKTLHAHSKRPLIIENKLLGYKVNYLLEYFRKSGNKIQFKGYSRFEEAEFKNERQKKNTMLQRRVTYLGSIMHFIRFLYRENLAGNDTIYDLDVLYNQYNYHNSSRKNMSDYIADNAPTIITINEVNNIYLKNWEDKFQMYDNLYKFLSGKKLLTDTRGIRQICFNNTVVIYYLGNLRISYMVPLSNLVPIYENGYYNPEQIRWYGAMSKNRVGDLLPLDYEYDPSILRK